jgi:hypothetical protein
MKPGGLAIAIMRKAQGGESDKYLEKQEKDDSVLAAKDAFVEFATFLKAGKTDQAFEAFKAAIELCQAYPGEDSMPDESEDYGD